MTIYALALIGALVTASSFVTRRLVASARLSDRGAALAPAAEAAAVSAFSAWDSVARAAQPVGTIASVTVAGAPVVIARLSPSIYWIAAEAASDEAPPLRRGALVLVRTDRGFPALVPRYPWAELH